MSDELQNDWKYAVPWGGHFVKESEVPEYREYFSGATSKRTKLDSHLRDVRSLDS